MERVIHCRQGKKQNWGYRRCRQRTKSSTVGKVNWELWVMGCVLVMQEAKPWEPPQSTKLYPRNTTKRAA